MGELAGAVTPIPKGMLKVKGFSEFVTPAFLATAVRKSQEGGQTILFPGQQEVVPGNKKASLARMNLSKTLFKEGRESGLFGQEERVKALKEEAERQDAAMADSVKFTVKNLPTKDKIHTFKVPADVQGYSLVEESLGAITKATLQMRERFKADVPEDMNGWKTVYRYGVVFENMKQPAHIHKSTGKKHVMLVHGDSDSLRMVYCHDLKIVYYLVSGEASND